MVSFYKLKYTNFISSNNYLVGFSHEINPESRFLALGTRKNYVVADLNYSCFLARRASLFLFGSLVRRSHPAVSFGYRFYDYVDLFSEFSTLSVSYVRDWVPGLLTNYTALFRTALKEEGALRRVGFFFQFPDILLMFGANNSIGFIMNEARSLQIPMVVTGDTSLSFSQVTYMLLGNYKSFKSTMFFVKLFLDLNAESRRFRTLRHYSVFKRVIKSIFLRRTLKSKLFSIKLARMFFIFKAIPELRVSQIIPTIYKKSKWSSAGFFKVSRRPSNWPLRKKMTMRRLDKGSVKRLLLVSKGGYVKKRRYLLRFFKLTTKLRRRKIVLNKRFVPLANRRSSLRGPGLRQPKVKVSKRQANKIKFLRKLTTLKRIRGFGKQVKLVNRSKKRFSKLLKIAKSRGLKVELLLKGADMFLFDRLEKLDKSDYKSREATTLPVFIPDKRMLRGLFPFLGYFAYGHMSKRLNTLLFYRTIFRQVVQKRKRILRLKRFTRNLKVISVRAKRFKSLNLAIHRRASTFLKLRARFKKFNKRFRAIVRLKKLRKLPGFNEKLYMRSLKGKRKLPKRQGVQKPNNEKKHEGKKGWVNRNKVYVKGKGKNKNFVTKPSTKWPNKKFDKQKGKFWGSKGKGKHSAKGVKAPHTNYDLERSRKAKEEFVTLMDDLYKQEIKNLGVPDKPVWLKDLSKINKRGYASPRKKLELKPKKRKIKNLSPQKVRKFRFQPKSGPMVLKEKQRTLMVKNFTPTQRHMLRVYRLLSSKYPSFVRRAERRLKPRSRISSFPRTLDQFLLRKRRRRALAIFKRTGKLVKVRPIKLPKQSQDNKQKNLKYGKGKKPWDKNKGKNFPNSKHPSKKGPDKEKGLFKKEGKKPYHKPTYYQKWDRGDWRNKSGGSGSKGQPKNYNKGGVDKVTTESNSGRHQYHKAKPPRNKKKEPLYNDDEKVPNKSKK